MAGGSGKGGSRPGAGNKSRPLALTLLQGNPGHRKLNLDQPDFARDAAQPLEFLSDRQRFWFRYYAGNMAALGLDSSTFEAVLTAAALRTEEIEICSFILDEKGMSYATETQSGSTVWKTRPELAQRNEALRHLHTLLCELGLTPSAINRLKAGGSKPTEVDPFEALLKGD